jgi:hypothetical protein
MAAFPHSLAIPVSGMTVSLFTLFFVKREKSHVENEDSLLYHPFYITVYDLDIIRASYALQTKSLHFPTTAVMLIQVHLFSENKCFLRELKCGEHCPLFAVYLICEACH